MTQNSINNSASILDVDNIRLDANTISSTDTNGDIVLAPDGSGTISVTTAPIVPTGDRADSLGSATNSWDNLYCDGVTFDDGTTVLSTYLAASSFTPVLEFGGGTTGITYSTQAGRYNKIGAVIEFSIRLVLTNKGSSTGSATITGLPFTSATDGSAHIINLAFQTATNTTGGTQFYGQIDQTSTTILLKNCGSGVDASLTDAEFNNTTIVNLTGFYWDA